MSAPHSFSLRQLQYLIAVADTLSFRKAAEICHVSQPSLSAQLAELESGLGVRVFERDRRHVLLTMAGRDLVDRGRRILAEADGLRDAAKRVMDPFAATMRIGVIPTISPYLLPGIMPAVRKEHPRLKIVWVEERTSSLILSLSQGTLDAALLALEADIGRVDHAVIAKDPFVLATPRDHPMGKRKAAVSAEELQDVGMLLLDDGHCFREQALAFCSESRAHELEFRATSLSTLAQMVASGAGVTLLPELSVATESKRADLRIRGFSDPSPHRTIGLVWRKGSPLAEALQKLSETIRRAYPSG
jgi:LysR family transcriptional regulator, hydrogen peroxide-inducible genes activator